MKSTAIVAWIGMLLAVLLVLAGCGGSRTIGPRDLQITSPAMSEIVDTPFTVYGVGTPGIRLTHIVNTSSHFGPGGSHADYFPQHLTVGAGGTWSFRVPTFEGATRLEIGAWDRRGGEDAVVYVYPRAKAVGPLAISEPLDGARVPDSFTVTGRARPGQPVLVAGTWWLLVRLSGRLYTGWEPREVPVAPDGTWTISLKVPDDRRIIAFPGLPDPAIERVQVQCRQGSPPLLPPGLSPLPDSGSTTDYSPYLSQTWVTLSVR